MTALPESPMEKEAKMDKKPHQFTQEHAVRMYRCLQLVHSGLQRGHIKSKPIISIPDDAAEGDIQSMDDIVAAAMDPADTKLAVGFPARKRAKS